MLLLHAFPLDGSMWPEGLGEPVDYPGHGSLADWADGVAARLERPGLVCGLSMGGYASFELVLRHPERVRALVLADTKPEPDAPEQRAARDENIAVVRAQGSAGLFARVAPTLLRREPDPAVLERARAIAERQRPQRLVAMLEALRDRRDASGVVAGVEVPVLVVCGEEDGLTPPAQMRALAEALPKGRYVEIPGAGHLSALEQPERFAAVVRDFAHGEGAVR